MESFEEELKRELSKPKYKDMFAVPVSKTHIMIDGVIVNAKEFDKAMRAEYERQYGKLNNK
jgi:hypothetical protein